MIRLNLSCFPAILSPISMYMSNKEQYDKNFLSLNPKYEKNNTFLSYLGGPGGPLRRTQVNENFRAVTSSQSRQIITREKNNHQFFIYGPQ